VTRKFTCPSCQSHLSALAEVYDGDAYPDACPTCGLAGETLREIYRVRETHASAEVTAKFEELAVRAGKAEAEATNLKRKLARLRSYLGAFDWEGREREYHFND